MVILVDVSSNINFYISLNLRLDMMPLILYKCRAWVIFVDIFIPELGLDIVLYSL